MTNNDFDNPEPQDASGNFREPDELSNDMVTDLADDIAVSGIDTPLTVQPLSDGTFRLLGGHGRYRALRRLRS